MIDMDSSESPTFGEQEGSAYNGRFGCTCYHPLFVFNQFGDVERCTLRPGNAHSAAGWRVVPEPVVARYRGIVKRLYFRGDAAFANPEKYEYLQARGWGTRSGCRPTGFCRTRSDTCSSAGRATAARGATLLRQLQLSGAELEKAAACPGEGRVPLRRALSSRRLYRHQPGADSRARRRPLQPARRG